MPQRTARLALALLPILLALSGCSTTGKEKPSVTLAAANPMLAPSFEGFSDERLLRLLDPLNRAGMPAKNDEGKALTFNDLSDSDKERFLRLAFWHANVPEEYGLRHRSQIQDRLIAASNQRCDSYLVYLKRISTYQNGFFGTLTTILGGAGAIVTGENTARLLSGLAGISSGIRGELNQATFESLATSVIIPGIQNTRSDMLKNLLLKRAKSPSLEEYTIELAIADAIAYHGACSMSSGIAFAQKSIQSFDDIGVKKIIETLNQLSTARSAAESFTIGPLNSLVVAPTSVQGGTPASGTVSLSEAAIGATGTTVTLTSDNVKAASVPPNATVPAGQRAVLFPIATQPVSTQVPVTITATYLGVAKTAIVTVTPSGPASFALSATTAESGTKVTGTVALVGASGPSGTPVALSSSNAGAATIPPTVTVPTGAASVSFDIAALPVQAATAVTFTASSGGASATAGLTITPPPATAVTDLTLNSATVSGGTTVAGTVKLSTKAAAPGATVVLSVTDTAAITIPATVVVSAGQDVAVFSAMTANVAAATTVTLSASFGGATKTATLTVTP